MPEGFTLGGGSVQGGVHDDPDAKPDPSADAPRGWTWDRRGRRWRPKQRGPVLFGASGARHEDPGTSHEDSGESHETRKDPRASWRPSEDDPGDSKPLGVAERVEPDKVMLDDIGGLATLFALPVVTTLAQRDPYCGAALADNMTKIIEAAVPLLAKSQMVCRFVQSGGVMQWAALAAALRPVAAAVIQHHVTKSVEIVQHENPETGEVENYAVRRDLSAYSTDPDGE
ncbi:MAG: hypothetical protein ACYCO9_16350 [Streptosporangiaceae bacterium]